VGRGPARNGTVHEHQLTTLDNGVRIASEAMAGVRSVALGVFIGVGSRDEPPAHNGVSHFIEHLLFRGTDTHTALAIAQTFDRFGAELNAATSRELTEIYARVKDTHLDQAVAITSGMVRRPTWDDLEQERAVVLEEIAMYDDTPDDLVHDLISAAVFPEQALGRPVVGTHQVLQTIGVDDVAGYHHDYYAPTNVVVSAAGSVDHDQLVAYVSDGLGILEGRDLPSRARVVLPDAPRRVFQHKDTEQYHLCLAAPGISRHDPRRFAGTLLDQILGGGASSRLFQEIRERRGMAYAVFSYASHYHETGMVGIYLGTREENVEQCLAVVGTEIAALASGAFTPDELGRAKDAAKGRLALSMESTSARMGRLGRSLLLGTELLDEDEICDRIDAVSEDDVAALAGELFAPDRLSVAAIGTSETRFDAALDALTAGAS
jgi:predicted Zn-dependent peptidase